MLVDKEPHPLPSGPRSAGPADDAEARLSVGASWLLLTCDETRCRCVSPASSILLSCPRGHTSTRDSPALEFMVNTILPSFKKQISRLFAELESPPTHTHPHTRLHTSRRRWANRPERINPATQRNAGRAPTPLRRE